MAAPKLPRKNDPKSIATRQQALGLDGVVTAIDLTPFAGAQESLTGAAVIPVSVVGPLDVSLGHYELDEPLGKVVEVGERLEDAFGPALGTHAGARASPPLALARRQCRCRAGGSERACDRVPHAAAALLLAVLEEDWLVVVDRRVEPPRCGA